MSEIKKKNLNGTATVISIGANPLQNRMISRFARENNLNFMTYTESEWATFEEIDQYIQEEELSKQVINLPIGANQELSLNSIQKNSNKHNSSEIKDINVNKTAKRLKIGRATLYRKLEKYGLSLKKEREKKLKKAA